MPVLHLLLVKMRMILCEVKNRDDAVTSRCRSVPGPCSVSGIPVSQTPLDLSNMKSALCKRLRQLSTGLQDPSLYSRTNVARTCMPAKRQRRGGLSNSPARPLCSRRVCLPVGPSLCSHGRRVHELRSAGRIWCVAESSYRLTR